jgi:DNA-binding NtrC family response regulator
VSIAAGSYQDRRYDIRAQPLPTAAARSTLMSIDRLARSAVAVAEARLAEREEAAVWPEPAPEQQLGLVCASTRMLELVKTIRRVASTDVPVLITGETGVGKELCARALHQASLRKQQIFLPLSGATDPREMPGLIGSAAGGTLFLDEIGEMSLESQPKLLRLLESGEALALGANKPALAGVRVVAATSLDLEQLVATGRFREDLFYRLNVVRIHVPPLRERREEIPFLVDHFLAHFGRELHRPALRVADETLEYLVLYAWPGNVRQLANEIQRMVALAEPGAILMPAHLSADLAASRRTVPADRQLAQPEIVVRIDQPLAAVHEHIERALIQRALAVCEGGVDEAAKMLGLSRKGLYLKRQRLGLA